MIELELPKQCETDLFARASIEELWQHPFNRFGYRLTQVFEPHVLTEIAMIENVPLASLETLRHGRSDALDRLNDLLAQIGKLSVVENLSLCSALISISRFEIAKSLLRYLEQKTASPREAFEMAMLNFVIHNRCNDTCGMRIAFDAMRFAIETNEVPDAQALDAASQAIVWQMKSKLLAESDFSWFQLLGNRIARESQVGAGTLSSWHRAMAMIPASKGDSDKTMHHMTLAKEAAERTIAAHSASYELHFLKTYYESTVKQHMYVSKDADMAEKAGRRLIHLDPAWTPSYAALAESMRFFGKPYSAARLFEKAARMGPPYVGHHFFKAALCYELSEDLCSALSILEMLHDAFPDNSSVIVAGAKLSVRISSRSGNMFRSALDSISLTQHHIEYLNGHRANISN